MKKILITCASAFALLLNFSSPLQVQAEETEESGQLTLNKDGEFTAEGDQSFITSQPRDAEVNYPDGAQFQLEVKDPSEVASYAWYASDGANVFELDGTSASTDTLIIPATTQDDPVMGYVCQITLKDGRTVISEPAYLSVINSEEDRTVLFAGNWAVEPGETLDLSETTLGSGTIRFDANGSDITFDSVQMDNSTAVYDRLLSPGTAVFLMRRNSETDTYNIHFNGENSVVNTYYDPDYNAGGVAFNAYFGSGDSPVHPTVVMDGEGSVTLCGGTNLIYTDGNLMINTGMKLSTYGEYFTDGITANDLRVGKDVNLEIEVHGTAIHTEGDLYFEEGSKTDITSAPARVSNGPTAKDILFLLGSLNAKNAEIHIRGIAKEDSFVPYGRYMMLLEGIALNGEGSMELDHSTLSIDLSAEESADLFAANLVGISAPEPQNSVTLTGGSLVNITVNTPTAPGAAGMTLSSPLIVERDSTLKVNVTGQGETFAIASDEMITLSDSSLESDAVSMDNGAVYGVVCKNAEIKLSAQKYSFHSIAKGGIALAADSGERVDEAQEFEDQITESRIVLGSKSRYMTPKKAKTAYRAVPGYGSYIKAETVMNGSALAEEVLIGVKAPSMIPYMILAAVVGLLLGFSKGRK